MNDINKTNEQTDDMAMIKKTKGLKYDLGQVVYLTSDLNFTTPMTITHYSMSDDHDYVVKWLNSQKKMEYMMVFEDAITLSNS